MPIPLVSGCADVALHAVALNYLVKSRKVFFNVTILFYLEQLSFLSIERDSGPQNA